MKTPKKLMLLLLVCLIYIAAGAAKVQTVTVYFAKDKHLVNAQEGQKLYALKNADVILLHGHTDADGSTVYNETLSAQRVEDVRRIVAQIAPGARIETKHYGEYKPINSNMGEEEKTANRRVEVSFIVDPLLSAKVPVQSFTIDTRKEQVIKCKQGTEVVIPAGTFNEPNVTVQISEYYNPLDIFSANLSTRSNNTPIETAGMIYITAEANGKNVEPKKELQYKFPRNNKKQDFRFFEGVRDKNFNMNWVLPEKKTVAEAIAKQPAPAAPAALIEQPVVNNFQLAWQWGKNWQMYTEMTGNENGRLDTAVAYLSEGFFSADNNIYQGCLKNMTASIDINADGRISSTTTNYTDKNSACDRESKVYLSKYLPKRFAAANGMSQLVVRFETDSLIDIAANNVNVGIAANNRMQLGANNEWTSDIPEWSKDHLTADYETDKIVLTAQKLGWVNCDRFMSGQQLVTYAVKADTNANVRLVLNKYKAYFVNEYGWNGDKEDKGEKNKGNFSFLRIPANEPVTIISTKKENGKLYLAMKTSTTKAGLDNTVLTYKEVTKTELEKAIQEMKL